MYYFDVLSFGETVPGGITTRSVYDPYQSDLHLQIDSEDFDDSLHHY